MNTSQDSQSPRTGEGAHTPTPWKFTFESVDPNWAIVTDATGSIIANVNTESGPDASSVPATRKMPAEHNAAFIVRACNSHHALVAENKALREALERAGYQLASIAACGVDRACGYDEGTISDAARAALDAGEGGAK